MSQDKIYVIGAGGTGMRCLECFVHLCAMGMFDNKEINILTLDTDQSNGNLSRVWQLIDLYNDIKSSTEKKEDRGGKPLKNTFFSAKLNLTKFAPNYPDGLDYLQLAEISNSDEATKINRDLASLFLSKEAQTINLTHGYRATTHLGSQLMYHAIVGAAKNRKTDEEKALMKFIEDIGEKDDRRVFIFGSVFGGTGASSIPVVPKAFDDALFMSKGMRMKAKFGAALLTEYFKFTSPNPDQKKKKGESIIADSSYFTLNSQAAMDFYQKDPTVKATYKNLYCIGWPVDPIDFSKNKNEVQTITGGENQKNQCHITELVSAFAAYDFIYTDQFKNSEAEYFFREVPCDQGIFNFDFEDLSEQAKDLKNKFAGLYSVALLTLTFQQGATEGSEGITGWIKLFKQIKEENTFDNLDAQFKINITNYFKSFLFSLNRAGEIIPGWIYQIKDSCNGKLLLPATSFANQYSQIENINAGELLPDEENKWGKGKSADKVRQIFATEFGKQKVDVDVQGGEAKEILIAKLFNTISSLQKLQRVDK